LLIFLSLTILLRDQKRFPFFSTFKQVVSLINNFVLERMISAACDGDLS